MARNGENHAGMGVAFARARRMSGLSQLDAHAKLGVSRTTLQEWENGSRVPRADKLKAMCDLYRCSADTLLGRETEDGALPPGSYLVDEDKLRLIDEATSPKHLEGRIEDLLVFWFRIPARYRIEPTAEAILELERAAIKKAHQLLGEETKLEES